MGKTTDENGAVSKKFDLSGLNDFMQKLLQLENKFEDFSSSNKLDELSEKIKNLEENKLDKKDFEDYKELNKDLDTRIQKNSDDINEINQNIEKINQQINNINITKINIQKEKIMNKIKLIQNRKVLIYQI